MSATPQAVTAGLPHVPSLDGLPGMCAADDAALRHAAAAELLSAGDPALGAALHNSLSVDSLAANAGAGREGSHDSTCTAGGAAAGLTGALLVRTMHALPACISSPVPSPVLRGAGCEGSRGSSKSAGGQRAAAAQFLTSSTRSAMPCSLHHRRPALCLDTSAVQPGMPARLGMSVSTASLPLYCAAWLQASLVAGGRSETPMWAAQHAGGRQGPHGEETAAPDRVAPGEAMPSEGALEFLHQLVMQHQVPSTPPWIHHHVLLSRVASAPVLSGRMHHSSSQPRTSTKRTSVRGSR